MPSLDGRLAAASILAALVTAVAWIALAAWGGYHHNSSGSLVPVGDSLLGTTIVAAIILVLVVVAYLIARWLGISRSVRRQGPLQPAVPAR